LVLAGDGSPLERISRRPEPPTTSEE